MWNNRHYRGILPDLSIQMKIVLGQPSTASVIFLLSYSLSPSTFLSTFFLFLSHLSVSFLAPSLQLYLSCSSSPFLTLSHQQGALGSLHHCRLRLNPATAELPCWFLTLNRFNTVLLAAVGIFSEPFVFRADGTLSSSQVSTAYATSGFQLHLYSHFCFMQGEILL